MHVHSGVDVNFFFLSCEVWLGFAWDDLNKYLRLNLQCTIKVN